MMEKQELFCHACDRYVQFEIPAKNGRLIVECPNCGHEHYRVVRKGVITEDRWGSANAGFSTFQAVGGTTTAASIYATSSSTTYFLTTSWASSSYTTAT